MLLQRLNEDLAGIRYSLSRHCHKQIKNKATCTHTHTNKMPVSRCRAFIRLNVAQNSTKRTHDHKVATTCVAGSGSMSTVHSITLTISYCTEQQKQNAYMSQQTFLSSVFCECNIDVTMMHSTPHPPSLPPKTKTKPV